MTGLLHEARETSGATPGGLLRYVRAVAGEDAVALVLERAAVPFAAEQLEDQSLWWSYDTRIRLFEAGVGDQATTALQKARLLAT